MKLLYQRSAATPLTSISIMLPRTGVCLDPAAARGATRIMGRLMFMGAGSMDNQELNSRLERLGASMGASLANDFAVLRLETLTTNLDAALDLLLLSVQEPAFDEAEFQRLQSELLTTWIADREENKNMRAQEMYLQQMYEGAPNGYLPDGTEKGLRACTLDHVREQYARLFGGGEAFVAVLSDLAEDEVRQRVSRRIELPRREDGASYPWDAFAPQIRKGRRVTLIPDSETNTDELVFGMFSAREKDADWHIHKLIAFIFGGDMNSRMFRIIRGEHGYSYGASCWYESMQGRCPRDQLSPFSMYTFPAAEHTAEALPLVLQMYEELVSVGVTKAELKLAQDALINSHPFLRDTPAKLLSLQVGEALYGVESDDDETNRRRLLAVSTDDVKRVLQSTHHPEQLEVVMLGDEQRLMPLAERIQGVEEIKTVPDPGSA